MATTKTRPPTKAYLKLIERFPLRRIKSEGENRAALLIVDELMSKGDDRLSADEFEYLSLLAEQIEKFEKVAYRLNLEISVEEHLKILMKEHKLNQTQLGERLGVTQSNVAHILAGKQKLTTSQVKILAKVFHVPPAIFLGDANT